MLESNYTDLAQYDRCNNVVFGGISENMSDNNLEKTVISVLSNTDAEVKQRDINVCYRIGKPKSEKKKTIVSFVNMMKKAFEVEK